MPENKISYKWICLVCNTTNDKCRSDCSSCHSRKFYHGVEAVQVSDGENIADVKMPTIWGRDELAFHFGSNMWLSKCPACQKIMFHSDCACPHCHHFLTAEEKAAQTIINQFSWKYYLKSALIWVTTILCIAYMVSH
jgi:hypothetical protein